jgi:hypothetical protein
MAAEVSVDIVIDDGPHAGPGRHTVLGLCWSAADPLAVVLRVTSLPNHPALPRGEWVVLRDCLLHGLELPTGDGAVRIRPDDVCDRVWLELDRPGRAVCLPLPRWSVARFLALTHEYVPRGEEHTEQAVECLLDRVLYSS